MDDFEFDSFGLNNALKTSVVAVDVEFELLFKVWTVCPLYCVGFVSLSLFLHTQKINSLKQHQHKMNKSGTVSTLNVKDSYRAGKRELKLHTGI